MLALLLAACATSRLEPAEPGPGAAEVPAPPAAPRAAATAWPAVTIDEVAPDNDSLAMDEHAEADDWLELGAPDAPVDLSGWGLGHGDHPDWRFPAGVGLLPRARLVVWADDSPDQGPLHATLGLAKGGETLRLFAPDGAVVDELTWPALDDDLVYGRFPGGGVNRAASIVATPGLRNPVDPGVSLDPSDALFPPLGVIRLDLRLDDAGHDALAANRSAVVPAGLGFLGGNVYPVGLGLKGGIGSVRSVDQKTGWRVDLDEYVDRLRLRGQEHVTLNSMVQDPTTVHEVLAYQLLRDSGLPGSRVAHVELWMNQAYRGLYLNLETVDDQYLQRWFDDPDGNLYEGPAYVDLRDADLWRFEHDEQGAADVTDRSDLQALIDFLEQPPSEALMPELAARVDLDRTVTAFAVEVVMGHWDGYFVAPNNYRLYHEPSTDRWTLLPSGLDQTFLSSVDPYAPRGILARFCLGVPSCRALYDQALLDVAQRLRELDCEATIGALLPRVRPLFEADPLREASMDTFEAQLRATLDFCERRPAEIEGRVQP